LVLEPSNANASNPSDSLNSCPTPFLSPSTAHMMSVLKEFIFTHPHIEKLPETFLEEPKLITSSDPSKLVACRPPMPATPLVVPLCVPWFPLPDMSTAFPCVLCSGHQPMRLIFYCITVFSAISIPFVPQR